MKTSTVAALGGLGFLAWYLSRGGHTDTAVDPNAKGPGIPDDAHLYPLYCVGDAPILSDVLADNQPDPVPLEIELSNLQGGTAMQGAAPGWWQLFHEQCELPAGRLKISDLWPYHFQLANAMLAGRISRSDQSGRLYQKVLADIAQNKKTAQDLAIANQVISGVAAFIPVIGGAIKLAVGTGISEGEKGAIANATNDVQALTSLSQIKSGIGQGSPEGQMWLSNKDSNKPAEAQYVYDSSGLLTLYTVGLSSMGGYYVDALGASANPAQAVSYPKVTANGTTAERYTINPGYSFVPSGMRMRLFTMFQYGWVLPWLSPNAGLGVDLDIPRRIAGRAAMMRCFDIMSTLSDPIDPPMDDKGNPNRYWYNSAVFGPLMGCTLPPTAEDGVIRIGGVTVGYHGQDISRAIITRNTTVARTNYDIVGQIGSDVAGATAPPPAADTPSVGESYSSLNAAGMNLDHVSTVAGTTNTTILSSYTAPVSTPAPAPTTIPVSRASRR